MRKLLRLNRVLLGWFIVAAFVSCVLAAVGCALLGRWSEAAALMGIAAVMLLEVLE